MRAAPAGWRSGVVRPESGGEASRREGECLCLDTEGSDVTRRMQAFVFKENSVSGYTG